MGGGWGDWSAAFSRTQPQRWRASLQSENLVDLVHDGSTVLVAEGQFGVARFLGFRLRGGEGVAVFLPLEIEFFAVELEPGGGMTAALEGDEVASGLPTLP